MKVGILTYHSCLNYGANLQLYATVNSLNRMGHDIYVYDNCDYAAGKCRHFVETHVRLTRPCRTEEDFRQETIRLGIEAILVGSDAVLWFLPGKKEGHGAYPNPFWLRWAQDLPVRKALIAASSMGVMFPKLSRKLRAELKRDLGFFDYISVRDKWTLYFMKYLGVRGAELTFDPTSALPGLLDLNSHLLPGGLHSGKYLFFTFSNAEKADFWLENATKIAHSKGMKTCFVCHPDHLCSVNNVDVCISEIMDPLDWLALLNKATGYIGVRFHPIVLSHFFNVPYFSCDYYCESGIRSLLNFRSKTRDFVRRVNIRTPSIVPSSSFFKKVSVQEAFQRIESDWAGKNAGTERFQFILEHALGNKGLCKEF